MRNRNANTAYALLKDIKHAEQLDSYTITLIWLNGWYAA